MELDQNVLFQIATSLEYEDLLRYCSSSKRINRLICQQDPIWRVRLDKDFPDWKDHIKEGSLRQIYTLLRGLTKLKGEFKYKGTIYQLFKDKNLNLYNNKISAIPPEIGNLTNLQVLDLSHNQISVIPPEIGNLTNLRELYLYNNKIRSLPSEIKNLTNLQTLDLTRNQISFFPPSIEKLTNLIYLYLNGNRITSLPVEIKNLTNLQELYLDKDLSRNINVSTVLKNIPLKFI